MGHVEMRISEMGIGELKNGEMRIGEFIKVMPLANWKVAIWEFAK